MSSLNFQQLIDQVKTHVPQIETLSKDPKVLGAVGVGAACVLIYGASAFIRRRHQKKRRPVSSFKKPEVEVFDVAVVGAGPSGSTMSYYLAKQGAKVMLLEKKKFPRDKYCGDAVPMAAQRILEDMGVIQELVAENKGHYAQNGGFVSPRGNSFIGNSAERLGLGNGATIIAVKRIVLDEKIARAAQRAGANLTELTTVTNCTFLEEYGMWKVDCTQEDGKEVVYHARALVCADGAPSSMARQLGYVKTEPQGTCSRAYVKNNKLFKFDGVVFYPPKLLPGYCAIIREAGEELNFCTYIIPGGPTTNDDLYNIHHEIMEKDPFVAKCLGPNPDIERMKSASLRLGGIDKSFDDHLLIIGDAAGFIDPLTGEGIQYAVESGKIAADVLTEAIRKGDFFYPEMKRYQDIWYGKWGSEFYWSMKVSLLLYRFPIMLDAAAKVCEKRGQRFFAEWALVMTGGKP